MLQDPWSDSKEALDQRKKFVNAVEKNIKAALEPQFESWREENRLGTAWMRAGDVVRAMKNTLKNCEVEMRGELKASKDGVNYLTPSGSVGSAHSPPIRITALRNDVQHSLPPDAPISPAPYELLSSHAYTDSRTHELESLQNLFMVNGFPINKTVGGLSAKGEVMPGGLEQLSTYLNGTDSHENSHEVCPRPRRKAQALAIGAAPPLPSAFLTP